MAALELGIRSARPAKPTRTGPPRQGRQTGNPIPAGTRSGRKSPPVSGINSAAKKEGRGRVAHVLRRNLDLTCIVMGNRIYGLTKGRLSPTSSRGRKTVTSSFGSLEEPVNPLLYVMGYGANYVAQGTPADMNQLTKIIEEGIRYPGFAFINVQSPCVTYGLEEQQLKAHKTNLQNLEAMGHDTGDRAKATELAREYGKKLYTGVLYRNPIPPPTYGQGVTERQQGMKKQAIPRHEILNRFKPAS